MTALSRLADDHPYVSTCLQLIRSESHSLQIFHWTEGRVEGYLSALFATGSISLDEVRMATDELRDLSSSWSVSK